MIVLIDCLVVLSRCCVCVSCLVCSYVVMVVFVVWWKWCVNVWWFISMCLVSELMLCVVLRCVCI